jgi:hypothetical protein
MPAVRPLILSAPASLIRKEKRMTRSPIALRRVRTGRRWIGTLMESMIAFRATMLQLFADLLVAAPCSERQAPLDPAWLRIGRDPNLLMVGLKADAELKFRHVKHGPAPP